MKYSIYLLVILTLLPFSAMGEYSLKVRAREHFDEVKLIFPDVGEEITASGIGPNINIWYEDPYHFYFGLSYSWMILRNDEVSSLGIGSAVEIANTGVEVKYFPLSEGGLFFRLGGSAAQLYTKSTLGMLTGVDKYYGIGWEVPTLNKKLGVAFEAAWRRIDFDQIQVETYSPSIGFHFYGYL